MCRNISTNQSFGYKLKMDRIKQPTIRICCWFSILLILTFMVGLNVAAGSDYMVSHLLSTNKEKHLAPGSIPRSRSGYERQQRYEQQAPYGPRYSVPGNNTNNSTTGTQSPAEDKIFFPPYKFPYWGLPYGIYSKGGLFNPGLFPFVPGGPAFPPFDGIFGGPFGPGHFPGGGPEPFQGPGNYTKDAKSAPTQGDDSQYKAQNSDQDYEKPKKSKKKKKKKPCCTTTSTSTTPSTTTGAYDDGYQPYYSHDMPPEPSYPSRRYPPPRNYGYPPPRNYYNSYGSGRGYNPRKRPPPPNYGSMRSYYNEDNYYESSTTPSTTTTAAYSTTPAPASNAQTIMYLSPGYQSPPVYAPPVYPALSPPQSPYGPVTVQNFYGAQGYQAQPYHNPYSYPAQYMPPQLPPMQYPPPYGMPPPYQSHQPQYMPYPYPPQMPYQYPTTPAPVESTTTKPTTPYTTSTTTTTTPTPTTTTTTTTTTPTPSTTPYTTTTTTSTTPVPYFSTTSSTTSSPYHSYYFEDSFVKSKLYTSSSESPSPYYILPENIKNQYYITPSTTPTPLKEYYSNYETSENNSPNYRYMDKSLSSNTVKPGKMYTLVDIDYFRDNKISSTSSTSTSAPNIQNYYIQMPSSSYPQNTSPKSVQSLPPPTNSANYSYSPLMPMYFSSSTSTTERPIGYPISTSVSKTVSQKLYSESANYLPKNNKAKENSKDNSNSTNTTVNSTEKIANRKSSDSPSYKSTTTSSLFPEYEEYDVYEDYLVPDIEPSRERTKPTTRSGRSFSFEPQKKPQRLRYKQLPARGFRIVRTQNNHVNGTNIFLAPNTTIVMSNRFKPETSNSKPTHYRSIQLHKNSSSPSSQKASDSSPKLFNSNLESKDQISQNFTKHKIYTNFTIETVKDAYETVVNQTMLEKNKTSTSPNSIFPQNKIFTNFTIETVKDSFMTVVNQTMLEKNKTSPSPHSKFPKNKIYTNFTIETVKDSFMRVSNQPMLEKNKTSSSLNSKFPKNQIYTNFTIETVKDSYMTVDNQTKLENNQNSSSLYPNYTFPEIKNSPMNNSQSSSSESNNNVSKSSKTPYPYTFINLTANSTISNNKVNSTIYHTVTKFSDNSSIKISERRIRSKN